MAPGSRPALHVFDQSISARSPAGSCVLAEIVGLADDFTITAFSSRCDAVSSEHLRWVKVPLPRRPILFRYIIFQILAPLLSAWHRMRGLGAPQARQTTQGQLVGADVAYAHFCHRAYLNGAWKSSSARGARRLVRWLNHRFNAFWEQRAFEQARCIVVPSIGLARELAVVYPGVSARLTVLANPVDLQRYKPTESFDRASFRTSLGLSAGDTVLVFVALGDFARKGLDLTLCAVSELPDEARQRCRVLVVGGQPGEIAASRAHAEKLSIADRVHFVGLQQDVRPYLWASDLLAFPSAYEIFSLAILQAAAAGLPVLVSQGLYGAEEFVVDGVNGWVAERTVAGVGASLELALREPMRLRAMGQAARQSVQQYSQEAFVERWRTVYRELMTIPKPGTSTH